jgi:hypothetical protein
MGLVLAPNPGHVWPLIVLTADDATTTIYGPLRPDDGGEVSGATFRHAIRPLEDNGQWVTKEEWSLVRYDAAGNRVDEMAYEPVARSAAGEPLRKFD